MKQTSYTRHIYMPRSHFTMLLIYKDHYNLTVMPRVGFIEIVNAHLFTVLTYSQIQEPNESNPTQRISGRLFVWLRIKSATYSVAT